MYTSGHRLSTTGYTQHTLTLMALMERGTEGEGAMDRTRRSFLHNSAFIGAGGSIAPHIATAFAEQAVPFRNLYSAPW